MVFQQIIGGGRIRVLPLDSTGDHTSALPHRHAFVMLLWVTEGYGRQEIDFATYELLPGRLFLVLQGQVHRMANVSAKGWLILFEESLLTGNRREEILNYFGSVPFADLSARMGSNVDELVGQLAGTFDSDIAMAEHYLMLILLYAAKQVRQPEPGELPGQMTQVRKLKELINTHFMTEQTVSFYADRMCMTITQLNTLVKRLLNKTVHQLLTERLVLECKILLLTTALSVKEIAYSLGFADMAQFYKFVKKHTGLAPTEFRNSMNF
ncbi:helix-turn-helix domain-containing protein [Mucilaginibacter paludis]|uniref:Transcriptional regulator, AraC family n=1 Tax=Mucilaginibacter paludis DSM 18603 TaxID=714943 RepID=H1Y3G9_9SPHI|nr:helix-turn-helix domain-containing protein [Mucilaginibacter paludis]EHQ29737.1 transcriptional regulator, AraC family [Mucilaginibacter paludis DSM 18603]